MVGREVLPVVVEASECPSVHIPVSNTVDFENDYGRDLGEVGGSPVV
jgi:hypothetical protein